MTAPRVRFERVEDHGVDGQGITIISRVSCATCRWAEAGNDPAAAPFVLRCAKTAASYGYLGPNHPSGSLAISPDYEGFEGHLIVTPDFGCVQWEGKV